MAIVANKSLVLLCFLLAIAASQAEAACIDVCIRSFAVSPSATARDVVAGCTAKCALVENQRKMIDALPTPKTEDYNRTEAALGEVEEKLTGEQISLIDQLKKVNCPSTTARNCYDRCRMAPQECARRCGCTLEGTEAATATVEEEGEKLTRELISLIDELKKVNCPSTTARNCYDRCRMTPQECARRCGCTLAGKRWLTAKIWSMLMMHLQPLNDLAVFY